MAEEQTFIAVKPDGVQRGLVGECIARFERKGMTLRALRMVRPSKQLAQAHYAEHANKPFFDKVTHFLSSGPVVAMVWQGVGVVHVGRTLIGSTDPAQAGPGTIRGDYGMVMSRNIIHGSDSPQAAAREIALWFPEGQ